MEHLRTRLGILCLAATLALSSCSGSPAADAPPPPAAPSPEVVAEWTEIDVRAAALPDAPTLAVIDTAAPTPRLPGLLVGAMTEPGGAARAVVWTRDDGFEEPVVLDVGGSDAWAYDVVTAGRTTLVHGSTWSDGRTVPFLVESTDRVSWTEVPLPHAVTASDARFAALVVEDGHRVLLGIDARQRPISVDAASGESVRLTHDRRVRSSEISAAVVRDGRISVLADGRRADGGDVTVAFHSDDGGTTWTSDGALRGLEAEVAGAVATPDGIVATGSRLRGTDTTAAAWRSRDGSSWATEPLPQFEDDEPGWSTRLGEPVRFGGSVAVPMIYGEQLYARLLAGGDDGKGSGWHSLGTTPTWEGPGADVRIERHGLGFTVVRSGYGQLAVSHRFPSGRWRTIDEADLVNTPVEWWESVAVVGGLPVLVGGTTDVFVPSADWWTRRTDLTALRIREGRLVDGSWVPRASAGLFGTRTATAPDGTTVVLGEREFIDAPTASDETGLVGWSRSPSGRWRPVSGLAGPRTEFLYEVRHLGDEWVATGADRDSFLGSDHVRGAVWTSRDGRRWRRATGPFDIAPGRDSWLYDACTLPGGDLLALGAVTDAAISHRGLAFRRHAGRWSRFEPTGLGETVPVYYSCVSTRGTTIVQGDGARHAHWVTEDGRRFTPVAIGTPQDNVGEIVALDAGFVAPGGVFTGQQSRPALWLSADGREWTTTDLPVEHTALPTDVAIWGERLLVALVGDAGPQVFVLENVDDLLADLGS